MPDPTNVPEPQAACLPVPPPAPPIPADTPAEHQGEAPSIAPTEDSPPFFAWTEERYFELYLSQRKGFSDSRKDSFLRFDQTIVTLAIGAVALSVAFLEKQTVPKAALQMLFASWTLCIGSVLAILASLLMSSKADSAQIKSLDECMRTGKPDQSTAKKWNKWVYGLNTSGMFLCIAGIIGLVWFSVVTLETKGEVTMANDKKVPTKPSDSQKPSGERPLHEEQRAPRNVPLTTKIEKAAPAEDLAGPFNKDKIKK